MFALLPSGPARRHNSTACTSLHRVGLEQRGEWCTSPIGVPCSGRIINRLELKRDRSCRRSSWLGCRRRGWTLVGAL
eukprot:3782287-Prymnesium_polylepis.1